MQEPYGQNYETILRDIKQILKNWEIYHIMDGNIEILMEIFQYWNIEKILIFPNWFMDSL